MRLLVVLSLVVVAAAHVAHASKWGQWWTATTTNVSTSRDRGWSGKIMARYAFAGLCNRVAGEKSEYIELLNFTADDDGRQIKGKCITRPQRIDFARAPNADNAFNDRTQEVLNRLGWTNVQAQ